MENIENCPYPVILCGDFNDTPVSYCYREFDRKLIDSFQETGLGISRTYIGKLPSFRIDYVFHSPGLRSVDYETKDVNLSDHKPLVVKLTKQ